MADQLFAHDEEPASGEAAPEEQEGADAHAAVVIDTAAGGAPAPEAAPYAQDGLPVDAGRAEGGRVDAERGEAEGGAASELAVAPGPAPAFEPPAAPVPVYTDNINSDLSQIVPMEHLPVAQSPVGSKYHPHADGPGGREYEYIHHHHHRHHRHHRRHRGPRGIDPRKRLAGSIAIVLLALVLVPTMFALGWIWALNHAMSMGGEASALKEQLAPEGETANNGFYVLFVGSDAREGEAYGRGDVLMLGRVDPVARTVSLISIPRDTMIHIAGTTDPQKINATYAYGGASTAVYAVSHYAGVPISHYAEVDFGGLERLVDRLGGVWIEVPEAVQTGAGTIEAGRQLLSGPQALAYARERHSATGGDFGRARAQRLVVEAIIRQVLASDPLKMPGLIGDLAACVSTDYSVPGLVRLASQMLGGKLTIYSAACPSYAFWQEGVSYVGTMYDEWRAMMKRVDAGLDPNAEVDQLPEPQNSSETLGSAENALSPREYRELAAQNMTTDVVPEVDPQTVDTTGADATPLEVAAPGE